MERKSRRNKLNLLVVAVLTVALVVVLPFGVSSVKAGGDTQGGSPLLKAAQDVFDVNAYAAAKKVKAVFNANKGKVNGKSKLTKKITKNKKLGKLPTAKRSGYTFKGWYTKKSGGKKITSKTKIKKNTTYYARWKKASGQTPGNPNDPGKPNPDDKRQLTAEEKKLVGEWFYTNSTGNVVDQNGNIQYVTGSAKVQLFRNDGTYRMDYFFQSLGVNIHLEEEGGFAVVGGKLRLTNRTYNNHDPDKWQSGSDVEYYYYIGTDSGGEYLQYSDSPIESNDYKLRKQ